MGKNTYIEEIENAQTNPSFLRTGSVRSVTPPAQHAPFLPTEPELAMIRRLRTLQGAEYEAQYFDTNPTPRKELTSKIGNPTSLAISTFVVTNTMTALFLMNVGGVKSMNILAGMFWFTAGISNWYVIP